MQALLLSGLPALILGCRCKSPSSQLPPRTTRPDTNGGLTEYCRPSTNGGLTEYCHGYRHMLTVHAVIAGPSKQWLLPRRVCSCKLWW